MSNIGYFLDMFHNLGELSITLNNALNLLVRSYRKQVPEKEKREAKEDLLSFLSIVLAQDSRSHPLWIQQISEVVKDFLVKEGTQSSFDLIRQKIESEKPLSVSEIDILDDLISQISQQATVAFRKMRKAS